MNTSEIPKAIEQLKSIDCNNVDVNLIDSITQILNLEDIGGGAIAPAGRIPHAEHIDMLIADKLSELEEKPAPDKCRQLISIIIEELEKL